MNRVMLTVATFGVAVGSAVGGAVLASSGSAPSQVTVRQVADTVDPAASPTDPAPTATASPAAVEVAVPTADPVAPVTATEAPAVDAPAPTPTKAAPVVRTVAATESAAPGASAAPPPPATLYESYDSCEELWQHAPNGYARSAHETNQGDPITASPEVNPGAYDANRSLDTDSDGFVCEH